MKEFDVYTFYKINEIYFKRLKNPNLLTENQDVTSIKLKYSVF